MRHTLESQRSGLNRRPLGQQKALFCRISRRTSTLGTQGSAVKPHETARTGAETVPEPYLAALILVAALVGQARVA